MNRFECGLMKVLYTYPNLFFSGVALKKPLQTSRNENRTNSLKKGKLCWKNN